jgi:hypothetical protein
LGGKKFPPKEKSSPPKEKVFPPEEKSSPHKEKEFPPKEKSSPPEEKSSPPKEKYFPPKEKKFPPEGDAAQSGETAHNRQLRSPAMPGKAPAGGPERAGTRQGAVRGPYFTGT